MLESQEHFNQNVTFYITKSWELSRALHVLFYNLNWLTGFHPGSNLAGITEFCLISCHSLLEGVNFPGSTVDILGGGLRQVTIIPFVTGWGTYRCGLG